MNNTRKFIITFVMLIWPFFCFAASHQLNVTAVNKLSFGRLNQTIELSSDQLKPLGNVDLNRIHVQDAAGRELLCQAVDTDGDYHPNEIIFQADFAPRQTRHFIVYVGEKHMYKSSRFKAYGRFVRERFDDFAWENDRIAHRTYGKALETWKEEPLTSSAIDVWVKKVKKLVINDWYMMGYVTVDTGEGGDLYTCGSSRGDGGSGLWADGKLWVSKNYVKSHVLANGPIRVMFELTYDTFDVNGNKVKEVKRVSLDAGQNLDHYQIFYKPEKSENLVTGIGIERTNHTEQEVRKGIKPGHGMERPPAIMTHKDLEGEHGWVSTQQPLSEGMLNCAIVINPKNFVKTTEDQKNLLVLSRVPSDNVSSFWAGYSWSESGQFKDYDAWKTYVSHFEQELQSPIQITVSEE
ncbi:MAG TPA: DUF4861 family protein [Balneolales bacterium]|nr:DUF4861 family protein [Balneolales bacterium]